MAVVVARDTKVTKKMILDEQQKSMIYMVIYSFHL